MTKLFFQPLVFDDKDDAEDGGDRLRSHCREQGIIPFVLDRHPYFPGQVIVRHPLLDSPLLFTIKKGQLWSMRSIVTGLIKMTDARFVQSHLPIHHQTRSFLSPVVLERTISKETIQEWLTKSELAVVAVVESDNSLVLCKENGSVLVTDKKNLSSIDFKKKKTITQDSIMDMLVTHVPGLAKEAGFVRCCKWFLGLKESVLETAVSRSLALIALWQQTCSIS